MHSMPASAALRSGSSGRTGSSGGALEGTNRASASRHFSKKGAMSTARSRMTGRFLSGPMRTRPLRAACETWVRQVHRGRPLTVIAQEPHMPTRQAKR